MVGAERLCAIAEDPLVHPREVTEVDEVLDAPRGRALPVVGGDRNGAQRGVTPPRRLRERIERRWALPAARAWLQQHPDEAHVLNGGVALNTGTARDRAAVNGGDALHLTALTVAPPVIRADQAGLPRGWAPIGGRARAWVDPAEREGSAAMHAEVREGGHRVAQACDHQRLA